MNSTACLARSCGYYDSPLRVSKPSLKNTIKSSAEFQVSTTASRARCLIYDEH